MDKYKILNIETFFLKALLITFLCTLCFSPQLHSEENDFIRGEGNFLSREEDSLSFVREQLLANALRDVITKELDEMGLETNLFWQQFDQKFEEHFKAKEEALKKEYGLVVDEDQEEVEVSDSDLKEFNERLRQERLKARAKFGNLAQAMPSYSIQRVSRSTQMPNSRFLSLQARIDREILTSIYYDFTQEAQARHFPRLYLTTDFRLSQMNWSDTGVEFAHDFIEVVNDHWKRWLEDNFSSYIDEIIMTDPDLEKRLSGFTRMRSEIGFQRDYLMKEQQEQDNIEQGLLVSSSSEEARPKTEDDIMGESLWLKIIVQISKVDERTDLNKIEFEIDGEFVLIDMHTNELVKSFDFIKELRKFSTEDEHRLSSDLASLVYRIPVVQLDQLSRTFHDISANKKTFFLEVGELNNIQELLRVSQLLNDRGISARVDSRVDSYSGDEGRIQLSYQGQSEDVISIIHSLNSVELNDYRRVIIPDISRPYSLKVQGERPLDEEDLADDDEELIYHEV